VTDELTSAAVEPGAFTMSDDGTRWTYRGSLTFDNAASVREAASALPLPKSGRVDLSGLDLADSAALAVMFALRRRARSEHHKLAFEGVPTGLAALARVYGVEELL
jgi:phospholipid transport system transporter-binding protein